MSTLAQLRVRDTEAQKQRHKAERQWNCQKPAATRDVASESLTDFQGLPGKLLSGSEFSTAWLVYQTCLSDLFSSYHRCQPHTKTMRDKLLQKEGFHGQKRDNTKMNDNTCDKCTSLLLTIRFFRTVCFIVFYCGNFSSFPKFLWRLQIITVGIAV